jgi:tripartite-type tricarboxylate transporter receptor subunit TctC
MAPSLVRRLVTAACALAAITVSPFALAQAWPDGTTRIVAPSRPGAGIDTLARELAERLARASGQPVIVENRDGANSVIGTDFVAKAAGDGRTLLVNDSIALPVNAALIRKIPYDWRRDLKAIAPLADVDLYLFASPKRGFRTLQDVVTFARANPGVLNYGVSGNGAVSHLSMERLMAHLKFEATKVNYPGIPPMIPALINGEIDLMVWGPLPFRAMVAEGRVRVLVNGGDERGTTFPDVPTLQEAGLPPGLLLNTRFSLYAPGSTPPAQIQRMHAVVSQITSQPEFRERFAKAGLRVVSGDPESETRRLGEVAGPVEALIRSLNLAE